MTGHDKDDSGASVGATGGPVGTPQALPSAFAVIVWILTVLLCAGGIWVTRTLSAAHRGGPADESQLLSLGCSPKWGEGVSCDQVLQSRWATLRLALPRTGRVPDAKPEYLSVPVAWLGMAYFTALATWFLFIGQPSHGRRAVHLVPLTVVGVGIACSLFFLYLLFFRLPAVCPLCILTHVVNLLVAVGTLLLWPRRRAGYADGAAHPDARLLVAVLVLSVVAAGAVLGKQYYTSELESSRGISTAYQQRLSEIEASPRYTEVLLDVTKQELAREKKHEIPIDADDPIWGRKDAERTLVVFSDFQCPSCRRLHERIKREMWPALEQFAYPRGIRFIFKHYPLYDRCNPRSATKMHPFACDAARAVEAARIVGGPEAFWKMADLVYDRQGDLDVAPYVEWAGELGLDVEQYKRAMKSPEAAERIRRHIAQGAAAEMSSTPGLYLDGVRITSLAGGSGPRVWRYILHLPQWPPTLDAVRGGAGMRSPTTALDTATAPAAQPVTPGQSKQ